MRYLRLLDLRVRHAYYPDGHCDDLRIEPRPGAASGERALARHRLLARARPDGLEIVAPVTDDDSPLIGLAPDLRLTFDVRAPGVDFLQCTDLAGFAASYRGSAASGGPLIRDDGASPPPPGVTATIEITGTTAAWLAAPPRFTLELAALRARWAFYLLTARPTGAPQIVDGEPGRGLVFDAVQLAKATTSAVDDPVGHRLLARHPDRRCFRLTSSIPIAARRAPLRQLALRLGDELLFQELPSPALSNRATLVVGDVPSESLFHVIES